MKELIRGLSLKLDKTIVCTGDDVVNIEPAFNKSEFGHDEEKIAAIITTYIISLLHGSGNDFRKTDKIGDIVKSTMFIAQETIGLYRLYDLHKYDLCLILQHIPNYIKKYILETQNISEEEYFDDIVKKYR